MIARAVVVDDARAVEFAGTDRYRVDRRIGAGGMGVVYSAFDHERQQQVALKTLRSGDSETLYRLKQEFRALAELHHPNLVQLFELVVGETSFVTMELVDGVDFFTHVAGPRPPLEESSTVLGFRERRDGASAAQLPAPRACDRTLLRPALAQLALGLQALHAAGKVHRDVKPSNVLVTPQGRVVIVDFGLVADRVHGGHQSMHGDVLGTAQYMAPEQCLGQAVTDAADWYAMGVVLYEALTGRLPFAGSRMQMLVAKQQQQPEPPASLVADTPPDLNALCVDLLRTRPEERPKAAEVFERLGVDANVRRDPLTITLSGSLAQDMSGRRDELAALDASLAQVRQDGLAAVLVSGESGIGKSTLVRHFLRTRCNDRRGRVVLRGRCYERESVPYKAIDSLIDDLSRYWRSLPGRDANELLPRNAELLTRLFPVLGRVPAVAGAPRARTVADAQQLKNRAFEALRELLQRIAERNQLVLVLDDMQWVDGNTMELFADLTRPPDPPQVLLILVSRPEGLPALRAFLERMGSALHELELSPLAPHHARALAASLMDREAADPLVSRIVDETGGHPFFITELAHYLQTVDHASTESVSLDQVIERRVQTLSKVGRRALELIALTGQPVPQSVVARAADLEPGAFMQELGLLRTLHFVRTGGAGGEAWVETYHDRVRETVRETLGADARAAGYRRLALAFEEWGRESSELLVRLWRGAEAHDRAAEHARIAGDAAIATFDFERAAAHYELTLELGNHKPADERELRIAIAEAYASAGRALDASRAFDTATTGADPAQRLELRRRSAEQLLRGGYMEEGLALTDDVLRSIGLRAVGKVGAVARLLAYRMWLRVRGLRFRRRPPSELSQRTLTELDTLWSVSAGLSMVDLLQSTYFQCRHAVAALKLGEPSRIVRALALEAMFLARQGNGRRAVRFATRATEVADELDDPYGTALAVAAQGIIDFFVRNHWAAGVERFERAEEIMRDNYRYGGWEVDTLRLFATFCRMHLGRLRELERLVPTYVREAERLGDRFAVVNLRTRMAIVRLLRDQPDIAEKDAQDAIASWSATERGYQVQSWFALFGLVEVALYRGDAARAAEIIEQHSRPLRRSLLLVVPVVRAEWLHLQGRVLLARAAASGDARYLRATDSLARRLERGKIPLARALAAMLRAGVARLSGDRERARQTLAEALERLEAGDTQLYAPVVRRRLAAMLGGDEGAELQAAADAWFADNRVANPERWCELLLPGFAEA